MHIVLRHPSRPHRYLINMKHVPFSKSDVNNTNTTVSIVSITPVNNDLHVNSPLHPAYPSQHPIVNTSVNITRPLNVNNTNHSVYRPPHTPNPSINTTLLLRETPPVLSPSTLPPTSTTSSPHTSYTNIPYGLRCMTYSFPSLLHYPLPYLPFKLYTNSSRIHLVSTPYSRHSHCLPPHPHVPLHAHAPYVPLLYPVLTPLNLTPSPCHAPCHFHLVTLMV